MISKNLFRVAVIDIALAELKADPANPRRHSLSQIKILARAIREFGFVAPVLADRHGVIIAGHARVEAAQRLGLQTVPVVRLEHLSPEQVTALRIADNRIAELATWDDPMLGAILLELSKADLTFDLEVTGFSVPEIDLRIQDLQLTLGAAADPDDHEFVDLAARAVSRLGDRWQLGSHAVLCGDALKEESFQVALAGVQAAAVITDPPYNENVQAVVGRGRQKYRDFPMANGELSDEQFRTFLVDVLSQLVRHSLPGSLHYLFMDWRHVMLLLQAGAQTYGPLKNICVWDKGCAGMGSFYRSQHEFVCVFQNGTAPARNNVQLGRFGRNRSNLWSYPRVVTPRATTGDERTEHRHPTPKPVAMVADALLDCTARGDTILDPFLGSGTSLIAAERVGRRCAAIELDPLYVDAAIRRWQRLTGQQATLGSAGQAFDTLERGEVRHDE